MVWMTLATAMTMMLSRSAKWQRMCCLCSGQTEGIVSMLAPPNMVRAPKIHFLLSRNSSAMLVTVSLLGYYPILLVEGLLNEL